MSTLALFSIKGGVGKTTAAVNLAHVSAGEGSRTLLWDLDPQAAASYCLGLDDDDTSPRDADGDGILETRFENLSLLPFGAGDSYTGEGVRRALAALANRFDTVLVDCPAGLGTTTTAIVRSVDALVVPTIPTTLSTRTLTQLRSHLEGVESPPAVFPFLSMVDRRRRLHRDLSGQAAKDRSFLAVWVPYASHVERVGVRRGPIGSFARMTAPARAYELMWAEIDARLSGEHISSAERHVAPVPLAS